MKAGSGGNDCFRRVMQEEAVLDDADDVIEAMRDSPRSGQNRPEPTIR